MNPIWDYQKGGRGKKPLGVVVQHELFMELGRALMWICECVCVWGRASSGVIMAALVWQASSKGSIKASTSGADLWLEDWGVSLMGGWRWKLTIQDILCLLWESLPLSLISWLSVCCIVCALFVISFFSTPPFPSDHAEGFDNNRSLFFFLLSA